MGIHTNVRSLITRASASSSIVVDPFSLSSNFLRFPAAALKRYSRSSGGGEKGRGGDNAVDEEAVEEEIVRAPSLAEEFKRLEGEKAKEGHHIEVAEEQGLASQTADKAAEGLEEAAAVGGDDGKGDDPDRLKERVKTRFEEHEPGADYRRRGVNTPS